MADFERGGERGAEVPPVTDGAFLSEPFTEGARGGLLVISCFPCADLLWDPGVLRRGGNLLASWWGSRSEGSSVSSTLYAAGALMGD